MQFANFTAALVLVVGSVVAPSAQAQTLLPLFSFNSVNGAFPAAGVIRDSTGNFYGTTEFAVEPAREMSTS